MKCRNCKNNTLLDDGVQFSWCEVRRDNLDIDEERDCGAFSPATNADRIRAMSDEELYRFIVGIYSLTTDQYGEPDYRLVVDGNQFRDDESLIDWLRQEAEE